MIWFLKSNLFLSFFHFNVGLRSYPAERDRVYTNISNITLSRYSRITGLKVIQFSRRFLTKLSAILKEQKKTKDENNNKTIFF